MLKYNAAVQALLDKEVLSEILFMAVLIKQVL